MNGIAPPSHTEIERTDVKWLCEEIKQLCADMEGIFECTNHDTAQPTRAAKEE